MNEGLPHGKALIHSTEQNSWSGKTAIVTFAFIPWEIKPTSRLSSLTGCNQTKKAKILGNRAKKLESAQIHTQKVAISLLSYPAKAKST